MTHPHFSGLFTDLVTPFAGDAVDRAGFAALAEWQISAGVAGLVVCGEASEAPTLERSERNLVIRTALDVARRTVPVFVGAGSNSTEKTLALVAEAKALGADGVTIVTPYYNKPSQAGIRHHIETVAAAAALPVVVVNRPARTGVNLAPETMEALMALPNVAGLVDCTGDQTLAFQFCASSPVPARIVCGDDQASLSLGLMGASGHVSLAANVAPHAVCALHRALDAGNVAVARSVFQRLRPLLCALEADHPVSATKQALSFILGTSPDVRLPLVPVAEPVAEDLRQSLSLIGANSHAAPAKHRFRAGA